MKLLFIYIFLFSSSVLWAQEEERRFSLYFENDKAEITQGHITILDSIKKLDNKNKLDVHIKGYTNTVGEEDYNLELSQQRATNVTNKLREFTIISSLGYGELESDAEINRRVDIFIHLKKDHIRVQGEVVIKPNKKDVAPEYAKVFKGGDKITIEGIMFYQDRDVMVNESKKSLKTLLTFLQQNPNMTFKLLGHICCGDPNNPGRDFINIRTGENNLSEARAKYVYSYLVSNGINKNRMSYKGMAFRQPTGRNNIKDRRVEIEIISIEY
ncbi:MAG: outer membrane protein OmpA-like peptidoglycan-associated protein [Patiriisocius sp.]|jgi:outer membrane protein OmpA-like peptidoglycan-associated protein